jgi:hypothetical protein
VTIPARRPARDPGTAFLAFRAQVDDEPDDDLDLADPLLENRLEAAAALARYEERIRVAATKALKQWTALVSDAVLGVEAVTASANEATPTSWALQALSRLAAGLGLTLTGSGGEMLPVRLVEYPDGLTAAPEVPPDPNAVPPLSAQWTQILQDALGNELTGMLGEVFAAVLGEDTTVSSRPWVEEYVATVLNRLVGVADQTFELVRDVVNDGIAEGASIPTLRSRIADMLAVTGESSWAGRAEMIARTEVIGAYNGGHLQAWKFLAAETGSTREKVWLATIDRRTRKSHYRADGQRVALDARFRVGRADLDHPGDSRGPAEEVVSCRCTMMVVDADEETPDTADRQMRPAGEVEAEIERRREEDGDVRAYDDPDAVAGSRTPRRQEAAAAAHGPDPLEGERAFSSLPTHPEDEVTETAVRNYQRESPLRGFPAINGALRGKGVVALTETTTPTVAALDAALARSVVAEPVRVLRGVHSSSTFLGEPGSLAGSTITDHGFVSVTTQQRTADFFASDGGDDPAFFEILVPAGLQAMRLGRDIGEAEVLLPRGSRFLVTADRVVDGVRRIEAQALAPEGVEAIVAAAGPPEVDPKEPVPARKMRERMAWQPGDVVIESPDEQVTPPPENGPAGVTAAATERGSTMPRKKKGVARSLAADASGGSRKWVSDPYLAPFGEPTGDGRIFKVGSLHARDLPLPILFQESSGWGHEGSVVVGRILEVDFTDAGIVASGDYLDDEAVAEPVGKAVALAEQGLGHVSVDLAAVTAELVDEDGNPVDWDDLFDAWDDGEDLVVLEQVTDGELIAATQVATPAFASAKIRLVDAALMDAEGVDIGVGDVVDVTTEDGNTVRGRVTAVDEPNTTVTVQPTDADGNDTTEPVLTVAPGAVVVVSDVDEPTEPAPGASVRAAVFAEDSAGTEIGVGDTVVTDLRDENGEVTEAGVEGTVLTVAEATDEVAAMVTIERTDGGDNVAVPAAQVTVTTKAPAATDEPPDGGDQASLGQKAPALVASALLAGAGPLRPKKEWFAKQPLRGPTAMTITEDGQIYGHVAQWGQCHVGFANTCWTAPESPSDYAYFHVGEVVCDDGTHVAVGNVTLGPRHANERLGYRAAVEHYDQAGAGVGVVRCYEDEYGIQFAGALTPGVSEEQLYDMRRCPVSGDWRKIGGQLDLIGVLSVNSGGYPTPRFATDDYGRTALVAAPGVPVPDLADERRGTRKRRPAGLSQAQIMARIKAEVKAELQADERRRTRLARVAASIRRDPKSRLDELASRVGR